MVSTLKPLAILLVWLAPMAAFSQSSTCPSAASVVQKQETAEQNPIKIKRVNFTGNPVLSPAEQEEISAALSKANLQAYKSQQDFGSDLKARVTQQWQQRGYFKVKVGEPEIDPASFVATVRVDAGKQYRLGEMRFLKNTISPAETLGSLFPIKTGDVFNTHKVGKGIEEIRKLYGERGYINMSVIPTTEQKDDDNRVNLTMELDEGSQFRVGKVEVLGSDEAKRVHFISAAGLVTGSIYNSSLLQKAFAGSDSDGSEAMFHSVVRSINEADSTIDFKVDLRPCMSVSQK